MALLSFVSGYTLVRTLRQQQIASRDGNLSFRASTRAPHQTVKKSYGGGGGSSKLFLQCSLASSFGRLAPSSLFSTIDSSGSAGNKLSLLHIRSHTEISEAAAAPETTTSREACPAIKPEIQFSAFEAVDIRVGLITDAKAVNDEEMSAKRGKPTLSRKFLELTVDIGCETRVVVSECKYVMDVEDAVGRKVLLVANVPPTEILGLHSHGLHIKNGNAVLRTVRPELKFFRSLWVLLITSSLTFTSFANGKSLGVCALFLYAGIVLTGLNYDPTPMPRSFKLILPGLGRLPPGSQVKGVCLP